MRRTSPHACDAAFSAAARLADMSAALDGYPASSLIDYCIDAVDVEGATLARRQWLVAHILARWSEQLARDIEAFPSSELESFEAIRQRMIRARDALRSVRAILLGLGRLADFHAGTGVSVIANPAANPIAEPLLRPIELPWPPRAVSQHRSQAST